MTDNIARPGDILQIEKGCITWIGTVIQSGFTSNDLDNNIYRGKLLLEDGMGFYDISGFHLYENERLAFLLVIAEFGSNNKYYSFMDNNIRLLIRVDLAYQYTNCTIKLI